MKKELYHSFSSLSQSNQVCEKSKSILKQFFVTIFHLRLLHDAGNLICQLICALTEVQKEAAFRLVATYAHQLASVKQTGFVKIRDAASPGAVS